ncbi:MAG TPA: molybdopterin molybdenumtransferase MoeA, partial [Puia sp.]|nr:molybdopterin molybdenumtransferase MoeA [Puia sp.]
MITVGEAKSLVHEFSILLDRVRMPLHSANGLVLAEDQYARLNIPAYDQSSMDGYAFAFNDW